MRRTLRGLGGETPPITAVWLGLVFLSAAIFHFHPEYKAILCMNWSKVFKKRQFWRCMTSFVGSGQRIGMNIGLEMLILLQSGGRLEREFGAVRFIILTSCCAALLLAVDFWRPTVIIPWTSISLPRLKRSPFHFHSLVTAIICTESWLRPMDMTMLAPLPLPPFRAYLLPFLLAAQSVVMFGHDWRHFVFPMLVSLPVFLLARLLGTCRRPPVLVVAADDSPTPDFSWEPPHSAAAAAGGARLGKLGEVASDGDEVWLAAKTK